MARLNATNFGILELSGGFNKKIRFEISVGDLLMLVKIIFFITLT